MNNQLELELELSPISQIENSSTMSIDEAFQAFANANPHVYRNLRFLARQALYAGRKRIGMKFLFERLRWEYCVRTNHKESDFALNNNFTSRFARLLMEEEPELAGIFEIRSLRSD